MSAEPLAALNPERASRDRPAGDWRWSQHWRDVLFVHWAVSEKSIEPLLPAGIEADVYKGSAWMSAVAFRLEQVRWRGFPSTPWVSNMLELNLRTYVRYRGESGIFFLSMHADNRAALTLARWLTPLPYAHAKITYDTWGSTMRFDSTCRVSGGEDSLFCAEFEPRGDCLLAPADSLDHWLLERYRAFVPDRRGRLCRMMVEHPPWQVQAVSLQATAQGLGAAFRLDLGRIPDLSHFSAGVPARLWPFERT